MNVSITKHGHKSTLLRPVVKCHGGKIISNIVSSATSPSATRNSHKSNRTVGRRAYFSTSGLWLWRSLNELDPGIAAIFGEIKNDPDGFLKRLEALTYSSGNLQRCFTTGRHPRPD
jgi:hypothetical protein